MILEKSRMFMYSKEGVDEYSSEEDTPLDDNPDLWCLYDETPKITQITRRRMIVYTASPGAPGLQTWYKHANAKQLVLDLWSWKELVSLWCISTPPHPCQDSHN